MTNISGIKRLAVLIDGDNVSPPNAASALKMFGSLGNICFKLLYADFSVGTASTWKSFAIDQHCTAISSFPIISGKNSTDIALVIKAMDLLHSGNYDGFCIVSSDSDFTCLAMRIKESGLAIFGAGETKTPKALQTAYDQFFILDSDKPQITQEDISQSANEKSSPKNIKKTDLLPPSVLEALYLSANKDGWSNLGTFNSQLRQILPSFSPKQYGYKTVSEWVTAQSDWFQIQNISKNGLKVIYLKANKTILN